MKLPSFAYAAPASVDEAVTLLAEDPGESAVLAGGQSLLLELRYGDVVPRRLVDINRVAGLDGLSVERDHLRVGALVRHTALEHLPVDVPAGTLGRLLRTVAPAVAHPPIRTRGTFACSLAWAHPCAEWCALAVLTDAEVHVQGPDAARAGADRRSEPHCSVEYRRHAASVVARRALDQAVADARHQAHREEAA